MEVTRFYFIKQNFENLPKSESNNKENTCLIVCYTLIYKYPKCWSGFLYDYPP